VLELIWKNQRHHSHHCASSGFQTCTMSGRPDWANNTGNITDISYKVFK